MCHQKYPCGQLRVLASARHAEDTLNYTNMSNVKNIHIFIEYVNLKNTFLY